MIGHFEQLLHPIIHVDHIVIGDVNIVPQHLNVLVLLLYFCAKILSLILGGLNHVNHLVQVLVLISDLLLLLRQNLLVIQVTCIIIFTIFSSSLICCLDALELSSSHLGCSSATLPHNIVIVTTEFLLYIPLESFDFFESLRHFSFRNLWELTWLIFVHIGKFVQILHVKLQSLPGGAHQKFLTRSRFAIGARFKLVKLILKSV